jgi:hypothetical protein
MAYQPKISEAKAVFHRVRIKNEKNMNGECKEKSICVGFRVRLDSGHKLFYSAIHRTISVTEPEFQMTDDLGHPKVDATGHPVMVGGTKVTGYQEHQFRSAYAHCPNFVAATFLGFALAKEGIGQVVRAPAARPSVRNTISCVVRNTGTLRA